MMKDPIDVCVVGGAGHVGAPLAVVLANCGVRTLAYDRNQQALAQLSEGAFPFLEDGGDKALRSALDTRRLSFAYDPASVDGIPILIVTIGTPIDEFHNPQLHVVVRCLDDLIPHIQDGATIILRSTVFPGTTEYVDRYLVNLGKKVNVAFCPERVVQGRAIRELQTLPQIVSGTTPEAYEIASRLFMRIAPRIVALEPKEAEFAKLISNAYRYIQFAAANEFYTMVEAAGLNYSHVLRGLKEDYPRLRDLPGPGFAAGPCLMKDTMQLVALDGGRVSLGAVAMAVNEDLPNFIVGRLRARHDLGTKSVGILGMAFKADVDDIRDSLSYKLAKILRFHGANVLCSDDFVRDPQFVDANTLVNQVDIVIVGVPHSAYRSIAIPRPVEVVDLWGVLPSARAREPRRVQRAPSTPATRRRAAKASSRRSARRARP